MHTHCMEDMTHCDVKGDIFAKKFTQRRTGYQAHSDVLEYRKNSFLNVQRLITSHKYCTQEQGQLLILKTS